MTKTIKNLTIISIVFTILACSVVMALPVFAASRPIVETFEPISISAESATLQGKITNDGNCPKMNVWFEYGEDSAYGQESEKISFNGTGYFTKRISGLSPCARYYFRPAARNNAGVSYGQGGIFTTFCETDFSVNIYVKNLTAGDDNWLNTTDAEPFDVLMFKLNIYSHTNLDLSSIMAKTTLPSGLIYTGDLKIGDQLKNLNITTNGVNVGNIIPNSYKTITFMTKVSSGAGLEYGDNHLIIHAMAYNNEESVSDTCKVIVNKTIANSIAPASAVNTGIGADIFASVFLPLMLAILLVWLFRSQFVGLDKWLNTRKEVVIEYRAKKQLAKMIKEFQNKNL